MGAFIDQLKHAFAVEPDRSAEVDLPEELERLARAVVRRGMETPAMVALESIRPLSFLAGQAMLAAWPIVKSLSEWNDYKVLAEALEDRRTVARLADRIEELARADGDVP